MEKVYFYTLAGVFWIKHVKFNGENIVNIFDHSLDSNFFTLLLTFLGYLSVLLSLFLLFLKK